MREKEKIRKGIRETLLELLYPPRCPICDRVVKPRLPWKFAAEVETPEGQLQSKSESLQAFVSARKLGAGNQPQDMGGSLQAFAGAQKFRAEGQPQGMGESLQAFAGAQKFRAGNQPQGMGGSLQAFAGVQKFRAKKRPQGMSGSLLSRRFRTEAERRCCADCRDALPWVAEPACMKCGKPVGEDGREYCEDCSAQKHFFDRGVAAFAYTEPLRHSVYRMKAENRRDYVPFYAEAMASVLARCLLRWQPQVIVPIPMHPWKRRRRGYNQAELLARELGRLIGLPVDAGLLCCTRLAGSQKKLGRRERMRNLRGSFALCRPFPGYARVLLVDDVYTTGSTMDEASRVLREYGAVSVYFVVLCTGKGKKAVCTAKKV